LIRKYPFTQVPTPYRMNTDIQKQLNQWSQQLSDKEKKLHEMAAVMLKKSLKADMEKDNGSYYPEKSHAFKAWQKKQSASTK
jgi:hypothetical protein